MHSPHFNPVRIKPLTRIFQSYMPRTLVTQVTFHRQPAALSAVKRAVLHTLHGRQLVPFRRNHTVSRPDPKDASPTRQLYELSLGLSRTPTNGKAEVQCTLYNAGGAAVLTNKLAKLEIASKYGLSTRDLRTVDLPSDGFPHVLVRDCTLLIHMFDLRLLVQADQVVLFHIDETADHGQDNTSRVFSHDLEAKLRGDRGLGVSVNLPYELRVLEAALASVTSTLEAEYLLVKQQVSKALQKLDLQILGEEESLIHSELRALLDLVRNLAGIERRARHVRSALQDVLNEDQDMADMYLSDKRAGKPHALLDHQDVEYLLEAYFKASDSVVQEAAGLMGNIQRTEETIQSILNVRRNQIMMLEAKLEIIMVGLASSTLLAGLYGMNVVNYFEESGLAFGILSSVCLVGTALVWRYGLRQLRYIQKGRL